MQLEKHQEQTVKYQGNMLVLAGAGTGKTFCIIAKIKYLKETLNAKDEDFLVVSFTNESVNDLKRKLGNNIDIFTFHKLALNILNKNYRLISDNLLKYIIDEYFFSQVTKKEKIFLLFYFFETNYNRLLNKNTFKGFKKMIFTYIKLIQANNLDLIYLKKVYKTERSTFIITIIIKIYQIYKYEKTSQKAIDLDDLIIKASLVNKFFSYKHIFIDEFQDTSQIRFDLIKTIYNHSHSKLYFYGDDFQSIYHFSGCNLNIMLDIKKHLPDIKVFKLRQTFRNSQQLINYANIFITKNKAQIKKEMYSEKSIQKPIEIIYYTNPKTSFKTLINSLDITTTLVLGRNQKDIYEYIDKDFEYNNGILKYNDKEYKYLTIHSAKGLEEDYVIILNVSDKVYGIPNKLENHEILSYVSSKADDYPYAEERRVFFVGITRCKYKTFLMVPKNNPSIFVNEIKNLI